MYLIIFIEILFGPVKFKLDSDDIIISSISLAVFSFILALYLNYMLKKSNNLLFQRYEKSNIDFAYSINSVLIDHSAFSNIYLKNYAGLDSAFHKPISKHTKNILNLTVQYKNEFIQNQNLFYKLNNNSYSSLKILNNYYEQEIGIAVTTFKYYELQLSLMKEKLALQTRYSQSSSVEIRQIRSVDRSNDILQLIEKQKLITNYADRYLYLIESTYSNYATLGSLRTDDLRFEVQLIIQQLYDTYHNYGNTIYSLLNRYYSQLSLSLNEFSGRSDEYIKQLDYFKLVSEIRSENNIDEKINIILVNVLQNYRDVIAVRSSDSKANFYILQERNNFDLFPVNNKNSELYLAFDIDVSNGSNKIDSLEPAVCRRITDKEYKIIRKGVVKFS